MVKKILEKAWFIVLAALFSLLTGYFLLSRTVRGNELLNKEQSIDRKIENKADLDYVKEKDIALENKINENKADHNLRHETSDENIARQFTELKEEQRTNRDMIIEVIKETK